MDKNTIGKAFEMEENSMNPWLIAAIVIAGIAVLFFIVCLIAVVVGLKGVIEHLKNTISRFQKEQVEPLLHQTTHLNTTMNTLKADIDYKKKEVNHVIQAVKGVNSQLSALNEQSHQQALSIVKKVEKDPVRQQQIAEWTNKAMVFLQRKV